MDSKETKHFFTEIPTYKAASAKLSLFKNLFGTHVKTKRKAFEALVGVKRTARTPGSLLVVPLDRTRVKM